MDGPYSMIGRRTLSGPESPTLLLACPAQAAASFRLDDDLLDLRLLVKE